MTIKLIVAVDQGNAVGWSDGRLPWKLSADMKRFKELTTGHTVVMGFNTFVSLARPDGLPNRKNVVLTRKPLAERLKYPIGYDIVLISSLDWVKQQDDIQRRRAARDWQDEEPITWIIGGATVYEEALSKDLVDEMHVTLVHTDSQADVRLKSDLVAWKRFVLTQRKAGIDWVVEPISRQLDGGIDTSYLIFKRMRPA